MKLLPLPLPDQRLLDAAQGWLGLCDFLAANEELDNITPSLRAHPVVLAVRCEIYAKAKKWDGAVEIANTLVKMLPNNLAAWINLAYATRRKTGGSLTEAKKILLEAEPKFPSAYLIRYNLACYDCQLGNLKEALVWLERAIDLAGEEDIRLKALEDKDLEPLWARIGEI